MSINKKSKLNIHNTDIEVVNLEYFLKTLFRNKKLITTITIFSCIFAVVAHRLTRKTWQGEFQIVLSSDDTTMTKIPLELQRFASLRRNSMANKLKTQVGILESPSVLMPIFDYVKIEKMKIEPTNDELRFSDWKKSLKIELKKSTSILDISYRDKDKELILPVLNKMSKAFQEYTGKDKLKTLKITKKYLNDQIKIYKNKSASSIKNAQEFAMAEDLIIRDPSFNIYKSDKLNEFDISNTTIETSRVKAANQIRILKEQITNIEELKDGQNQLQYISATIPALVEDEEALPQVLEEIEKKLVELRMKYTENDKEITILLKKREQMNNLLKVRAIGTLKAQILVAEAAMKSATRPEGVILKYKELMREAERDESTLVNLENQLRTIMLEESRYEDPWDLITIPTLKNNAVAPRLRNYGLTALIASLFISSSIAIFNERKTGLIYEVGILKTLFKDPLIIKINYQNKIELGLNKQFLNDLIRNSKKVLFLKTSQILDKDIKSFGSLINFKENNDYKDNEIAFSTEFTNQMKEYDLKILIVKLDQIKFEEIDLIIEKLKFLDVDIEGLIIL